MIDLLALLVRFDINITLFCYWLGKYYKCCT